MMKSLAITIAIVAVLVAAGVVGARRALSPNLGTPTSTPSAGPPPTSIASGSGSPR